MKENCSDITDLDECVLSENSPCIWGVPDGKSFISPKRCKDLIWDEDIYKVEVGVVANMFVYMVFVGIDGLLYLTYLKNLHLGRRHKILYCIILFIKFVLGFTYPLIMWLDRSPSSEEINRVNEYVDIKNDTYDNGIPVFKPRRIGEGPEEQIDEDIVSIIKNTQKLIVETDIENFPFSYVYIAIICQIFLTVLTVFGARRGAGDERP